MIDQYVSIVVWFCARPTAWPRLILSETHDEYADLKVYHPLPVKLSAREDDHGTCPICLEETWPKKINDINVLVCQGLPPASWPIIDLDFELFLKTSENATRHTRRNYLKVRANRFRNLGTFVNGPVILNVTYINARWAIVSIMRRSKKMQEQWPLRFRTFMTWLPRVSSAMKLFFGITKTLSRWMCKFFGAALPHRGFRRERWRSPTAMRTRFSSTMRPRLFKMSWHWHDSTQHSLKQFRGPATPNEQLYIIHSANRPPDDANIALYSVVSGK